MLELLPGFGPDWEHLGGGRVVLLVVSDEVVVVGVLLEGPAHYYKFV